jgi:hypothetical protein
MPADELGGKRGTCFVCGAGQALLANGCYVVARPLEKFDTALADVFVDLEPHTVGSIGTGINRSRAASAP